MERNKGIQFKLCILIFFFFFNGFPLFYSGAWSGFSDEDSYLAHSLSLGLDFDLDYSNEPITGLNPYGTSPKHSIGPGIMVMPFVFLGSTLDRLIDHPIIRNHRNFLQSYSLAAIFLAKIFYFFCGLIFFSRGIQRAFPGVSKNLIYNFLVFGGTGILFYVFINTIKTHVFEFFALAFTFYFSIDYCLTLIEKQKWSLSKMFLTQAGVALTVLNRNSYINTILLLPIFLEFFILTSQTTFKPKRLLVYMQQALCFVIAYIPLALINFRFYKKLFPNIYDMYGLKVQTMIFSADPLTNKFIVGLETLKKIPYLLHIFFSMEFGLIYTAPLLLFGFLSGLYFFYVYRKNKNIYFFGFMLLMFWGSTMAVPLWWLHPGMDYGWRYIYCLLPTSAILVYWVLNFEHGRLGKYFKYSLLGLSVFSLFAQLIFGTTSNLALKDKVLELGYIEGPGSTQYIREVVVNGLSPEALMGTLSLRTFPLFVEIGSRALKISFDETLKLLPIKTDLFYSRTGKDLYLLFRHTTSSLHIQWLFMFLMWLLGLIAYKRYAFKD